MTKIRRLDKLPKRKVTVDDLLDRDNITRAIDGIAEEVPDIDEFIGIFTRDGNICWRSSGLPVSRTIYLMEMVKNILLNEQE